MHFKKFLSVNRLETNLLSNTDLINNSATVVSSLYLSTNGRVQCRSFDHSVTVIIYFEVKVPLAWSTIGSLSKFSIEKSFS